MAVLMENNTSVKEANAEVIVAKTVVTIDYSVARPELRSLLDCEIHFPTRHCDREITNEEGRDFHDCPF